MTDPQSSRRTALVTAVFSLGLAVCWLFPHFWYASGETGPPRAWLLEQTNVAGWQYQNVPVADSAERVLVADRLSNGTFTGAGGEVIHAFAARRYTEKPNDVGLFVHTPDRCWTEAGWKLELPGADCVELNVHGLPLVLERRLFLGPGQKELLYFGGMVGGRPLPYRLDHNLGVGLKHARGQSRDRTGTTSRFSDSRLRQRVWESFVSRQQLLGPKQFFRISTTVAGEDLAQADARLQAFVPRWLKAVDYHLELERERQPPH